MRAIEVIFFDWGDTLAYWSVSRGQAWAEELAELGEQPPEDARLREALAAADRRFRPRLYEYQGRMDRFWPAYDAAVLVELGVPAGRAEALARRVAEGFRAGEADRSRLFPETSPVLERLQAGGYRLGLISNNVDDLLRRMEFHGVRGHFEAITYSQEVGAAKPDPRIFRVALERMGCEPQRALHVGNDLRADVAGARGVGITPVLVDRHDRHLDAQCMRIRDLEGLFTRLPGRREETASPEALNLLHWLRRQLAQPVPLRERLEAAVANDDPDEVRRLLDLFPFTGAQRRYVEELLDEWERRQAASRPEEPG